MLRTFFHLSKNGFTLVEIMIVISIIVTLFSIGYFPFSYYVERARVESSVDALSQEWLLLHEDIRNGLLHDPTGSTTPSHAHMYVTFKKDDSFFTIETSTGGSNTKKLYKTIQIEKPLKILSFSGGADGATKVVYHLAPPFATGAYTIDTNTETRISSGIILEIGYPGATLSSGRSRQILLRPRYD